MYTVYQRALPALGKEADVRAELTAWAKQSQSRGRNVGCSARLFSSDGPTFNMVATADDLNTLEEYRRARMADPDWQDRVARLATLLRSPLMTVVFETLIPPGGSGPVGIVTRTTGFPAPGKVREFRSIAEEHVKASQAAGVRMGLAGGVFSSIGPVFQTTTLYPDIATLDKTRTERLSVTREAIQRAHQVSREPMRQRVYEVLVPLQT
jgi:hypothetical protein